MKGTPAIYKGRIIDKKVFRAFVYGANGERKLVESWDAYEALMQTGIWFSSLKDVKAAKEIASQSEEVKPEIKAKPKSKPKARSKPKAKVEEVEEPIDEPANDGMVFEVTEDGA
jgi:hypothetical protein